MVAVELKPDAKQSDDRCAGAGGDRVMTLQAAQESLQVAQEP